MRVLVEDDQVLQDKDMRMIGMDKNVPFWDFIHCSAIGKKKQHVYGSNLVIRRIGIRDVEDFEKGPDIVVDGDSLLLNERNKITDGDMILDGCAWKKMLPDTFGDLVGKRYIKRSKEKLVEVPPDNVLVRPKTPKEGHINLVEILFDYLKLIECTTGEEHLVHLISLKDKYEFKGIIPEKVSVINRLTELTLLLSHIRGSIETFAWTFITIVSTVKMVQELEFPFDLINLSEMLVDKKGVERSIRKNMVDQLDEVEKALRIKRDDLERRISGNS